MRDILQLTRDNRLIAFSLFFWGLGDGLFYYIQPLYLKQLGADPVATGTVLSIAALTAALSLIPAGTIADYFGRRPVVIFGWALGAVGAGLMYLATDLTVFTIGLMIYMGTGFVIAPLNAYISEARGKQSVQRALTLVSAGFMAGAIVSPTLGGMLASAFGLRSVYGIACGLFVISCLALVPLSPQPVIRPTIGGTRYGPLLRNKPFLQFLLLYFAALVAIHLSVPFASNFIVDVHGLNTDAVGLLGSFNSLGALILNLALGHTVPRRGFLLSLACMVLWGALFLWSGDFAILAAALFYLHYVRPLPFLLSSVLWFILMVTFWYLLPRMIYRRAETFRDSFRAILTDQSFRIENDRGGRSWEWSAFSSWYESPEARRRYSAPR